MKPYSATRIYKTVANFWLPVILLCLISWSTRLPANLIARIESDPKTLASLLQQADQAETDQLWLHAVRQYQEAILLADPTQHEKIKQQLRFCQASATIEKRYRDESITQLLKHTDVQTAHDLLAEICEYTQTKFHKKINQEQLIHDALYRLRIAAENPLVRRQLRVTPPRAASLQSRLDTLRKKTGDTERLCLRSLVEITKPTPTTPKSEKEISLDAWILTELAYDLAEYLDDYSYILTPRQYTSLYEHLGGFYVGIGVDLLFQGAYPTVFDVVQNSPAHQAGIQPGDLLTRIAEVPIKDQSDDVIAKLLTGAPKTPVTLCVRRDAMEKQFSLTRRLVEAPTVRYMKILDRSNQIGYLRISAFDRDTALEVQRAVNTLKHRGAKTLIIDLRCNGGGIMTSAIDTARLFLDHGTIVSVHSAKQTQRYTVDKNGPGIFQLPLVLLVDQSTASAAEIFAAALQDHKRATLVGTNTLGKAVVQTVYPLNKAPAAFCVTTASYLPPSQKSFQHTGIVPDIAISNPNPDPRTAASMADLLSDHDPALQKAIEALTSYSPQFAKK